MATENSRSTTPARPTSLKTVMSADKSSHSTPTPTELDEKDSNIIVIQPGSLNTIIGRSSDALPSIIPTVVARRMKRTVQEPASWPAPPIATVKATRSVETELIEVRDVKGQLLPGRRTQATLVSLQEENKRNRPVKLPEHNDQQALEALETTDNIVVGTEALRVKNDSKLYELRQPLSENGFATYDDESETAARADFVCFIKGVMASELDITDEVIPSLKAILIIPDTTLRKTIKHYLELLLQEVGFSAVLIHHSSVCTTFGAGVNLACVVDIGHTGFNVSCVQDGMAMPSSRIHQPYGGLAIEQVLNRELIAIGAPFQNGLNLSDYYSESALRHYKEQYCRLDLDDIKRQKTLLAVRRPANATIEYTINIDKQLGAAALVMFYPEYCCDRTSLVRLGGDDYIDPSDAVFEDNKEALLSVDRKRAANALANKKAKEAASDGAPAAKNSKGRGRGGGRGGSKGGRGKGKKKSEAKTEPQPPAPSVDSLAVPTGSVAVSTTESPRSSVVASPAVGATANTSPAETRDPTPSIDASTSAAPPVTIVEPEKLKHKVQQKVMGLHQAVIDSILTCENNAEKQAMFRAIIVTGGGGKLRGLNVMLQQQLYRSIPFTWSKVIEEVAVLERPKDMDPRYLAWKGGAIMASFTITGECWLTHAEWLKLGVRAARERLPFEW